MDSQEFENSIDDEVKDSFREKDTQQEIKMETVQILKLDEVKPQASSNK